MPRQAAPAPYLVTGSAVLVDGINPGSVLSVQGSFNATLSGTTLAGATNGNFINLNSGGNCFAADHQFIFTRR